MDTMPEERRADEADGLGWWAKVERALVSSGTCIMSPRVPRGDHMVGLWDALGICDSAAIAGPAMDCSKVRTAIVLWRSSTE
jgi:hypothetical protein